VTEESVDTFRARAATWLAQNRQHAPRDYGAICPPDLVSEAKKWQRLIFDSGFAGIHWPTEHGGQGLSPAHHGAWVEECAKLGVPPVLNMVGLVLAGGAVMTFGTDELKKQHLRSTLTMSGVSCSQNLAREVTLVHWRLAPTETGTDSSSMAKKCGVAGVGAATGEFSWRAQILKQRSTRVFRSFLFLWTYQVLKFDHSSR